MAYKKGTVNRMLSDEYCFMRPEERPRYGTPAWENGWLIFPPGILWRSAGRRSLWPSAP